MSNFFFTDNKGGKWSLKMSWRDAQTLKEHPDINLDIGRIIESNQNIFEILYGEPVKLVAIAVELTRRDRPGMSDDEFLELLEGDVLDDVSRAFVNGLVQCLPKHLRTTLLAAVETSEKEVEKIAETQANLLRQTPTLSKRLKEKLEVEFEKTIATVLDSGNQ